MNDKEYAEFVDPLLVSLKDSLPPELKPKTNYTVASIDRDHEQKLIEIGFKPVDLSKIPIAEHYRFDHLSVTIPNHIATYLANCEFPLTQEEINMLEVEMEKHHGVQSPCFIDMTSPLIETGKSYQFLPEAEQFHSGFLYIHAD